MRWPWHRDPPPPPNPPPMLNGIAARVAPVAARQRLERDRNRVDEWTEEIRHLFGGQP